MAKIAVADNTARKFCGAIIEHWLSKGHEVMYESGASEKLFEWADLYYIDWWDGNLSYLYNWYQENPNAKKPKIAVRAIDWDVWCEYVPTTDQKYVDFVDHVITIAPHMYEHLKGNANYGDKLCLIRPGVDLEKFTFREKEPGYNIAMVTGDIWMLKNVMEGLMIFAMLVKNSDKPWHLHWRGQYADHAKYMKVAVEHFLKTRGLEDKVTMYAPATEMNEWLEPMDYILNPSIKEAFSYAVSEAMSKGIKPVINNWYGSSDIWPKDYAYNTIDEAIAMFDGNIKPHEYREFVRRHYDLKRMLKELNERLGT